MPEPIAEPNNGQPAENGQPAASGQPANAEPTGKSVIVLDDGKEVTPEMWKETQAEITRLQQYKAQHEAANPQPATPQNPDSADATELQAIAKLLIPILQEQGIATVAGVEKRNGENQFYASNPHLVEKKELITTLSQSHPTLSPAEIVAKYKLGSAIDPSNPNGDVMGDPNRGGGNALDVKDPASISAAIANIKTPEDLKKFQESMGSGTQSRLQIQRNVIRS